MSQPADLKHNPAPEDITPAPLLGPRLFDISLATVMLLALSPWLLRLAWRSRQQSRDIFQRQALLGRFRIPFQRLRFACGSYGSGLAALINILRGDMAFVGPIPFTAEEDAAILPDHEPRFALRPGLFSSQRIRQQVGIDYEQEDLSELQFYHHQTLRGNLGLIARSLIGALLTGDPNKPTPTTLQIFGIELNNTTMDEALDWLTEYMREKTPSFVAFMNSDCLNIVYRHDEYRQALAQTARILPDGIGIKLGCRILGIGMKANVNGTDLFPRLCERSAREGFSLYLLGARPGIALAAAENMQTHYPGLRIAGVRDGYFSAEETPQVIEAINASGADALLVAFGAPKQELWLAAHHEELSPAVRLGVGGLFDFYSGRIPRAPLWMREIGLEWTWRLWQEPGRMWRRYLIGNPLFLYRVWRQKQTGKHA